MTDIHVVGIPFTQCYLHCERVEKKTPDAQVRLSAPELRHLLTALLWRGWHGIEHLLHWSEWRRRHQFHAMCCHYRKRGSALPIFYLQLYYWSETTVAVSLNCEVR